MNKSYKIKLQNAKDICKQLNEKYQKFDNFIGCGIGIDFKLTLMFHEDFKDILEFPKTICGFPLKIEYCVDFPQFA